MAKVPLSNFVQCLSSGDARNGHREYNGSFWCLTTHITSESSVTKTAITGWAIFLSGSAIWLYGYFITGHPSIIDWHARTPWWIADFLPNLESELGMLLCIAGIVPMYWPDSQSK